MGRNGLLSSAAAGGSLIAASVMLVIGVSAVIGFRGFDSARAVSEKQSVVLERRAADREAGSTTKPATAVIGARAASSARKAARPAARKTARRAARRPAAVRSSFSARPVRKTHSAPAAPAAPIQAAKPPATVREAPAAPAQPEAPAANTSPSVQDVVEEVTGVVDDAAEGTAENVGGVLLDLRDVLP